MKKRRRKKNVKSDCEVQRKNRTHMGNSLTSIHNFTQYSDPVDAIENGTLLSVKLHYRALTFRNLIKFDNDKN